MIAAVLLGLTLILLTRKREFFPGVSPNPDAWTDAEFQIVRGIYPEFITKLENAVKARYGAQPLEPERLTNFANKELAGQVKIARDALAGKLMTRENITAHVQGIGYAFMVPLKPELTEFLIRYFEANAVTPAPAPAPPAAGPGRMAFVDQSLLGLKTKEPAAFAKVEEWARNKPSMLPRTDTAINAMVLENIQVFIRMTQDTRPGATLTSQDIDSAFQTFQQRAAEAVARGQPEGPMPDSPDVIDALKTLVKAHYQVAPSSSPAPIASLVSSPAPIASVPPPIASPQFITTTWTPPVPPPGPMITDEDIRSLRARVPGAMTTLENWLKQSGGPGGSPTPDQILPGVLKEFVNTAITEVRRRGPVTSEGIDATIREIQAVRLRSRTPGPQVPSEVDDALKTIMNAYYQVAPSSSPVPSEPAVQGTVVTSISSLEQEYEKLRGEYESVVNEALGTTRKAELEPLVEKILQLNSQITVVLDQLITALAAEESKGNTDFTAKRNDFALRLSQIKKDYGDLRTDTDKLTTLRRIRQYEESKATSGLKGYLIAFGVAVSLLIVLILFKMFQPSKNLYATNPTATSPAISPNLEM